LERRKKTTLWGGFCVKAEKIISFLRQERQALQERQHPCSRQRVRREQHQRGQQQVPERRERGLLFCHRQPEQQPEQRPESETFACRFPTRL
jgi:hypothetical protein